MIDIHTQARAVTHAQKTRQHVGKSERSSRDVSDMLCIVLNVSIYGEIHYIIWTLVASSTASIRPEDSKHSHHQHPRANSVCVESSADEVWIPGGAV